MQSCTGTQRTRSGAEDESQIGFHEVSGVVGVNRGFGLYGDMVVTLTSGDKLEIRSIPECVFTMLRRLFCSSVACPLVPVCAISVINFACLTCQSFASSAISATSVAAAYTHLSASFDSRQEIGRTVRLVCTQIQTNEVRFAGGQK